MPPPPPPVRGKRTERLPWVAPRIARLHLGSTDAGSRMNPYDDIWEGSRPSPGVAPTGGYRMPRSGESAPWPLWI